ncbi:hypothetical protein BC941DRAFT_464995 [Chlamydoabsidia padenii]|nr:hypothetical protein BC941DRAFT_464995 [Chlamydoabsidia padenii]
MPMMTYKSGFEPKDARTINTYEDDDFDDFDDWSLETTPPRPRRRKTATQALVEFLNTTSPEEFKKNPPPPITLNNTKRTSTPFFLRRRNKNKSSPSNSTILPSTSSTGGSSSNSLGAPNTIPRKNYIEIIAHNPTRLPQYYDSYTGAGGLASGSKISLNEPILPTRRDSSLYSASIRSLSIKSPTYSKVNLKSPTSPRTPQPTTTTITTASDNQDNNKGKAISDNDQDNNKDKEDEKKRKMVDAMVATCDGMDVIEAGLIQRLKQCQLYGIDKPMDVVTARLTEEHIRALKVSASQQVGGIKNKSRHVQVQTDLSWDNTNGSRASIQETNHTDNTTVPFSSSVEELQQQLAQERQERRRLEAALELTCDHFEVLSGLAYKKLRELWEEKLRWENACIEMNEQLLAMGQHKNGYNNNMDDIMTEDYPHSDFGS